LPAVILKVGTFDDPSLFGGPRMAIYMLVPILPKGHGIGVWTLAAGASNASSKNSAKRAGLADGHGVRY